MVAEKFEAMVTIGDRNSRIKDFFDLSYLASHFEFDRATLSEAVRRTFARRHTLVPPQDPIGLTPLYWQNPSRPAQIRAFARRAAIEALTASRAARDPAGLAADFHRLAEVPPAPCLLPWPPSLASQLVDYLSVSERVDPDDVVRALASLELEADWTDGEPPAGE